MRVLPGRVVRTVFKLTASGQESVLHPFQGAQEGDGALPLAALTDLNGYLYGTTSEGGVGVACFGTVSSVSTSGRTTGSTCSFTQAAYTVRDPSREIE